MQRRQRTAPNRRPVSPRKVKVALCSVVIFALPKNRVGNFRGTKVPIL
jgi:hypothetical protein